MRQNRHDLGLCDELHFSQSGTAARRVVDGDHQAPVAQQEQGHHPQSESVLVGQLFQRSRFSRIVFQSNQGITHFASQGGLQVQWRHHVHAHQELTERCAAICFLLRQGVFELHVADQPQRHQCVTNADHGHFALALNGVQQLRRCQHIVLQQDVAEFLTAQLFLKLSGLLNLNRRGRLLLHQQFADTRAHLQTLVGGFGNEDVLYGVA